jgi:dihydrofolate reductase
MGKLIYSALCSVDGYVADAAGGFEWAAPDDGVHAAVNDLMRPAGTHLYGRRIYDVLVWWETIDTGRDQPEVVRDFAQLWRNADKIVYSTTMSEPRSTRTRIDRRFDADEVRALKLATDSDLVIGGPTLAASAFEQGLIDECHLFLSPISVGDGLSALPRSGRLRMELVDHRRFDNGVVHLSYRLQGKGFE